MRAPASPRDPIGPGAVRPIHLLLALAVVAGGCASGAAGRASLDDGDGATYAATSASSDLVTAPELARLDQGRSLYDALQQLRPLHLAGRGSALSRSEGATPLVYLDGVRMGDAGMLRTLSTAAVREVRFLSPTEARLRLGPQHGAGAILVTTRRAGR